MSENVIVAYRLFVGIDIAAETFMAAPLLPHAKPATSHKYAQTGQGFRQFTATLTPFAVAPAQILVVLEATSTYWINLATFLHDAGFAVSVVNPAQVHYFAKAQLKRSKTDAVDAQTLAQFAEKLAPPVWTPPPAVYHELQQRLAQRDTLLNLRQQVKNQLHALTAGHVVIESVRERMVSLIATLTEQIAAVDTEIGTVVVQDKAWQTSIVLLQTIPGIGLLTACWLVVATLNFTTCPTAEAATQYAGLAPVLHESGTSIRGRPRIGHAGNVRLRKALYMAGVAAIRAKGSAVRSLYDRLRAKGKPSKVIICAMARKLLHIAFAVVTKACAFVPNFGLSPKAA